MEREPAYRVTAWWTAGRSGIVKSSFAVSAIHFSAHPELGGLEGRWTPKDLLLSAIASCLITTFQEVARSSNFEFTDLEAEVEAGKHLISLVTLRVRLTIADKDQRAHGMELLNKAADLCWATLAVTNPRSLEMEVAISNSVDPH
jgi:organic hydroperoxide reductase OsmC/OhrA